MPIGAVIALAEKLLFVADLDAINAHFVSVATDPDYDINEISTIIDSVPASGCSEISCNVK